MQALVSPNEPVDGGFRIAQVEPFDKIFPVAPPMFWTDCPDDCEPDLWYYDTSDNLCKPVVEPPQN